MTDKKRTDKMPVEDLQEKSTARAVDGHGESAADEGDAAETVPQDRNFVNAYTTRYPFGTSRRSEHIF